MKHKMAIVKNIVALEGAYEALAQRGNGVEGMGLVFGDAGFGKTTAITWLRHKTNAVHVRALATWTQRSMLGAIMRELGVEPMYRSADNVQEIVRLLGEHNRGLYVDELDYLLGGGEMNKLLDTLRDIHDLSKMPVLLIGMAGVQRKVANRLQLARRITQFVEFLKADKEDARTLTNTVCEVDVEDDLLEALHKDADGNIGLIANGLSTIEGRAKGNGWKKVDLERWGNRPFFLGPNTKGPKK